jgi:beta-N-acetylhexosaminidase
LLLEKTRLGLNRQRTVPLETISQVVASPESRDLSREIAERSITLVRDDRLLVPFDSAQPPKLTALVMTDGLESNPLPYFQAELRRRFPKLTIIPVDSRTNPGQIPKLEESLQEAQVLLCATLVRTADSKGTVGLPAVLRQVMEKLVGSNKPIIWTAFGNPYLLTHFPQIPAYLATFSLGEVSQVAAVKALAGEIAIGGRLPVSIPGCATIGSGLNRSAKGPQKE